MQLYQTRIFNAYSENQGRTLLANQNKLGSNSDLSVSAQRKRNAHISSIIRFVTRLGSNNPGENGKSTYQSKDSKTRMRQMSGSVPPFYPSLWDFAPMSFLSHPPVSCLARSASLSHYGSQALCIFYTDLFPSVQHLLFNPLRRMNVHARSKILIHVRLHPLGFKIPVMCCLLFLIIW